MEGKELKLPEGAKKLSPLDMNKLAILKDHTVITFNEESRVKSQEEI